MDINKIQEEIFGKENQAHFFKSLTHIKGSVHCDTQNRNLFLDLLDSPAILPLFNPISTKDMNTFITNSDLSHSDSNQNNALLIAIDKNIGSEFIEHIVSKSNLSHKNSEGVNALTLAVLNQNLLSTALLYDIHNSRDESFSETRKGISVVFYENRNLDTKSLNNKYLSLKRLLKNYEENLKEKNKTHKDVFSKFSI